MSQSIFDNSYTDLRGIIESVEMGETLQVNRQTYLAFLALDETRIDNEGVICNGRWIIERELTKGDRISPTRLEQQIVRSKQKWKNRSR